MSTPILGNQSIEDFIKSRQKLLGQKVNTTKVDTSLQTPLRGDLTAPQESVRVNESIPRTGTIRPTPERGEGKYTDDLMDDIENFYSKGKKPSTEEENSFLSNLWDKFGEYSQDVYASQREQERLAETDPEEYLRQYADADTRLLKLAGGPTTRGLNVIKGAGNFVRKGLMRRPTGQAVAGRLGIEAAESTPQGISKVADEVSSLADEILAQLDDTVAMTAEKAGELGSKVLSKTTLAVPTIDDFTRILQKIPEEAIGPFYEGLGSKLVQAVKDMPRLTKSAQANLLSPSGRNILQHALRDMPANDFKSLMKMLEKGLWSEARNKILKWGVGLPLLGYFGLRRFLSDQ